MALTSVGNHANISAPGCACPHTQRHTALSTRTSPLLMLRHLTCPVSHSHQALDPHHHSHQLSRRCRWRLTARRTTNIGRHLPWTQSSRVVGTAPGTTAPGSCRHTKYCLTQPSASGAAPGGPTGRSKSLVLQGAASASHHYFNPRYNHHNYNHQQHQPSFRSHAAQHQHQGGMSSRRGGAWGTHGPLAPPAGGFKPGSNPRYDSSANLSATAAPQTLQHIPVPAPSPQSKSSSLPLEESQLAAGAGRAASVLRPAPFPPLSSSESTAAAVLSMTGTVARHGQPTQGPHSSSGDSSAPSQLPLVSSSYGSQPPVPSISPQLDSRLQGSGELTQLERLFVKDFALVSEQTVRLGPGLNVITGESGSGKSVLVEAFSQILGAPAPQECVRAPAEMAVIEGTFLVGDEQREAVWKLLSSCGLPLRAMPPQPLANGEEDDAAGSSNNNVNGGSDVGTFAVPGAFRLTVRREISQAAAGGHRSRVFLNGSPTSLRVLREVGALLVDTNGQHSSMSLRDSATQLDLLDRIAGTSLLADTYGAALARLRALEGRLDELDELDDEQERATMQKLVDAVAKLRVQPGEERELRRVLKKMEARRVAVEQCGLVRMALCGEAGAGGVTDALRTIEAQLNAILAQEEQNHVAAAVAKAPKGSKDGSSKVAPAAADGDAAGAAHGEDEEAGEEDEDGDGDGDDNGAAAGVRMMEEALEQVAAAKDMLAAAETTVRAYARRYQFSQADHDATADRLARIERLMKQASAAGFGGKGIGGIGIGNGAPGRGGFRGGGGGGGVSRIISTEQLLEVAEECAAKLAAYYEMEGQRPEWEAQLETLVSDIRGTALLLSSRRRAAAAALRSAVEGCLRDLAMGGSRFDVRIGWAEDRTAAEGLYVGEEEAEEAGVSELGGRTYVMGARGLDQVEFLLAAGPAEPLRPLAAVASGGESARVMLALKAAPAQAFVAPAAAAAAATTTTAGHGGGTGGVPIMILDELDSGIGARLGSAVGSILARMALPTHGSNSQIICVTHLPQVACYAVHHIKVQKQLPQLPTDAATSGATGSSSSSSSSNSPYVSAMPVEEREALTAPRLAAGTAAAAAATVARVTTSFVPLRTFEERCEEVAAMLGLDRGVAEEMLWTAQSQVAAMYPPGSLPDGVLLPGQNTHAHAHAHVRSGKQQEEEEDWVRRGGATVPAATAPQRFPADSGDDSIANVRRVVQETLRSGDVAQTFGGGSSSRVSAGFSVVVSPAMDLNAVRFVGGEAARSGAAAAGARAGGNDHSSASGGSIIGGGGNGVRDDGDSINDDDYDDREAAEAELSAQLLAGVEAAAMQHLRRMEAQAKEAAAAASVEAVTDKETSGGAPGGVSELQWRTSAPPAVSDIAMVTAGPIEGPGANEDDEEVASDGPGAGAPAPKPTSATATSCVGAANDKAEPSLPDGNGSAAATTTAAAAAAAAAMEAAAGSGSGDAFTPSTPGSGCSDDVAAAAVTPPTAPPPAAAAATGSQSADLIGLAATVQPSKSPLPYNFNASADGDADDGNVETESSAEAESVDDVVDSQYGRTHHGNPYNNLYDMEGAREDQGRPWYQEFNADDKMAEVYDTADPGPYMYGADGAVAGGRFVVVPSGSENEFDEMFRTIMSFSREDYADEAMRSHEVTLMEALRDAGMM
ncbi:hypothetical protein Vretifemale_13442 [Volvox reticuliferus]|uniref:DNA repair protein RecN n=1 Tax=Volvox reticuliferus TaxID=1737510 RepID=A0A8J4FS58_9CHLO|nr:hypothetical protein Vretifemale_13442 [Volvox reticuliferus]